jgi:hypothetical protein
MWKSLLLQLAIPSVALVGATLASFGQDSTRREVPLKVAELLDEIAHNRFEDESGVFGVGRLIMPAGHDRVGLVRNRGAKEPAYVDADRYGFRSDAS